MEAFFGWTTKALSIIIRLSARIIHPEKENVMSSPSRAIKALLLSLLFGSVCLMTSSCTREASSAPDKPVITQDEGELLFENHCSGCHPGGGNMQNPDKPIQGSLKLKNFETFNAFVRDPGGSMPPFSPDLISDTQVQALYQYLSKNYN